MSTICRLGVSCADRYLRASCRPCWMLVKCGGICSSLIVRIAHVGLETHYRVVERHRLGHQGGDLRDVPRLGEGVHLDELQEVAGIFAADQPVQRQAHALDVDVLAVVAHRAAHVQQHGGGALGVVAGAVDLDVLGLEPHRQAGAARAAWR